MFERRKECTNCKHYVKIINEYCYKDLKGTNIIDERDDINGCGIEGKNYEEVSKFKFYSC